MLNKTLLVWTKQEEFISKPLEDLSRVDEEDFRRLLPLQSLRRYPPEEDEEWLGVWELEGLEYPMQ